jgi:hypothetical protein
MACERRSANKDSLSGIIAGIAVCDVGGCTFAGWWIAVRIATTSSNTAIIIIIPSKKRFTLTP